MKVTVELDCTPEEARRLMGLPDVEKLNAAYVGQLSSFLQNASNPEQLQNFTKMVAPMGEAGIKMFSTFLSGALGGNMASAASKAKAAKKKDEDDG
jgi:hypothetical protein